MISIYTFSRGRELYIQRLVESLEAFGGNGVPVEHHICFQGVKPSSELAEFLRSGDRRTRITCHLWDQNYGTGEGNNRIVPLLKGDFIIKLDEDVVLRSPNFFQHLITIAGLIPGAVFSPYPVGLIRHAGGDKAEGHFVRYSKEADTYYTFRCVSHVAGMARIAPAAVAKGIKCPYDLDVASGHEDEFFAEACLKKGISMYYLENALIAEHQESTLGQMERFKSYFAPRGDLFATNSSGIRSKIRKRLNGLLRIRS